MTAAAVQSAVVARTDPAARAERYLLVMPAGSSRWVSDPEAATAFPSMRDATRMALRLPAAHRAYGLPREAELVVHQIH